MSGDKAIPSKKTPIDPSNFIASLRLIHEADAGQKLPHFFDDDVKREDFFMQSAQESAIRAFRLLNDLDYKTIRPNDYFAEMYKSDSHMQLMRKQLSSKQKENERREKLEQLKALRTYAKKIRQHQQSSEAKNAANSKGKLSNKSKNQFSHKITAKKPSSAAKSSKKNRKPIAAIKNKGQRKMLSKKNRRSRK